MMREIYKGMRVHTALYSNAGYITAYVDIYPNDYGPMVEIVTPYRLGGDVYIYISGDHNPIGTIVGGNDPYHLIVCLADDVQYEDVKLMAVME